ncbi:hypothetical protein MNEG_15885 [Monoraphidium neglectum]|uniref:Uncharacterized protein n=1 Tax=Monoraphidium neglectum TaxID=145388 RepID=A0A0D2IVY0_9CHLO|nr:hypothetical protein MNEG_15885 [Monoraphidium neglectum]KIY92077.1 hypothetical protein MNEG_15885 [Monoraphidium neglectum]|eukprot:XP_013891097.1 hypothetical protein MNEG_15885 [Monoraphidium neglectum]
MNAERKIWRDDDGKTLGYIKNHRTLTHVVIRNAGHMVPHDRPEVSQAMLETWVESTRKGDDRMAAAAAAAAAQGARALAMPTAGGAADVAAS